MTSQEAARNSPAISEEEFAEAVQWVGADGERLSGAPAVFAALATASASAKSASNRSTETRRRLRAQRTQPTGWWRGIECSFPG